MSWDFGRSHGLGGSSVVRQTIVMAASRQAQSGSRFMLTEGDRQLSRRCFVMDPVQDTAQDTIFQGVRT